MIRSPQPTDVLRYVLFKRPQEPNRVQVLEDLVRGDSSRLTLMAMCQETLSLPPKNKALVWASGRNILGLGTVRARSGPRSWEISKLFLDCSADAPECIALLEKLAQVAAEQGAHRIFLRIPTDDPLEDMYRRAGFFPHFQERLLCKSAASSTPSLRLSFHMRPRTDADSLSLFRLYNAVTPHKVRTAIGLTLEDWQDSQERCPTKSEEWVYENNGETIGWLKIVPGSRVSHLDVLVHPQNNHQILDEIVGLGLTKMEGKKGACAIVPEYQNALQNVLLEKGFEKKAEYIVMVKFTVKRIEKESAIPTKIAPIGG